MSSSADLHVPECLQQTLFGVLVLSATVSVVFVGEFSPLPITMLLDVWIIAVLLTSILWGRVRATVTFGALMLYLAAVLALVSATGAPVPDALQAYRWVLYLVAASAVAGSRWTRHDLLVSLAWWLAGLATIKALLTRMFLGPEERPGLFVENNFELALFCGLAAVVHDRQGRSRLGLLGMLGLLTVLSGSRSGAVAYLLLVAYAILRADIRDPFFRYLSAALPAGVAFIPAAIFQARAAESAVIDRVRFLDLFRQETADWDQLQWLFGTMPITPLSPQTCDELIFYEPLFSSEADGTCYSVILHAFAMRVIHDAGLVGPVLAFFLPALLMLRYGVPRGLTVVLVAIAAGNSLSVSGMNSPYVILPILLALLTARATSSQERDHGTTEQAGPAGPPPSRAGVRRRRYPAEPGGSALPDRPGCRGGNTAEDRGS